MNRTGRGSAYPVVVVIHGEEYDLGTGNAYDGSVLASYGQMIVVTLNYRLGVLGFMSTGDHNAPGNYALMDIVAALQWLKENIVVFGGDSNSISLLGQGYGASLVNLLLVSPVNVDGRLAKRGIVMSGSALAPWAVTQYPRYYTKELADLVNCSRYMLDSPKLLKCFKVKPAEFLINMSKRIRSPRYLSAFGPVVHYRSVIPETVIELMDKATLARKRGRSRRRTQLLIGIMKNEGLPYLNEDQIRYGVKDIQEQRIYRTYVNNIYTYHRQRIYDIIKHHYTSWDGEMNNETRRASVMDMLGDAQYVGPGIDLALRHAEIADTYLYSFHFPSRADTYPRWAAGVHGEDLPYVFGAPLAEEVEPFPSVYTRSERQLSEAVMSYLSNFIKTGNPNLSGPYGTAVQTKPGKNRFMDMNWPAYDASQQQYFHIGTRPEIRRRYRARQVALWLNLIPKLHEPETGSSAHLLDQPRNTSLYLKDTREVDIHFVEPPPPPTTTSTPLTTTQRVTTIRQLREFNWGEQRPPPRTVSPWPLEEGARTNGENGRTGSLTSDSPIALSIIIVVGCLLVFLNVLVFAIVYYQRDKKRNKNERARIANEEMQELNKQNNVNHGNHVNHASRQNHHVLHADTRSVHSCPRHYDSTLDYSSTHWSHSAETDKKSPLTVV